MNIDSSFLETIKGDFAALWSCKERGGTLEVSAPFLYPNSNLARVFITKRDNRFIVTEDGDIAEVLRELLPEKDFTMQLREMASDSEVKLGSHEGSDLFFMECEDPKVITSRIFDMLNFCTRATTILLATSEP